MNILALEIGTPVGDTPHDATTAIWTSFPSFCFTAEGYTQSRSTARAHFFFPLSVYIGVF
jgi:hypothetical protein